jgi:hypothetical protein
MTCQAKSECAEYHRAAAERIADSFFVPWLFVPRLCEVLDNLEHGNRRMGAWAPGRLGFR